MPTIQQVAIPFQAEGISTAEQLELYEQLLLPRMIEEKMLILLRQGKISKWFSGIGQEAISVGAAMALKKNELLFTMHRNLGVFTSRSVPLERLFAQWQGKSLGYTKGRDRSFHFGTLEHHIVGMISHLGPQLSLADGVALANKIAGANEVTLAFTGEGATSEGEFHEALNLAAVWKLPVIFVIENNGYGLSTPTNEQYACKQLSDRAKGYGMRGITIDGNNVLEVYSTIKKWASRIRQQPEPILIECMTFRMRGHEEASGTKYVPQELMDEWAVKDPVQTYEEYLLEQGILQTATIEVIREKYKTAIREGLELAYASMPPSPNAVQEQRDVYAPFNYQQAVPTKSEQKEVRFVDAIADGLELAMEKHERLVLMGQDIGEYGGVFKITDGLLDRFGKERVRNTPLCESAIIGAGLGLSLKGWKAMVEMQFADFVSCGFNQIVNNLAKLHYRWGANADVVIRMPTGGSVGAGPFHSQTNEAWFTHTPGLKVVYPANPYDAKGLLLTAFEDPNPVLFFEHKALYRTLTVTIPDDYYTVPIGKAAIIHSGTKATIITYGLGVEWAKSIVQERQLDVEIIDLRTLLPLDYETISESVKKTNRVLLLHEDTLFGGIGGEIAAYIGEHLFDYLDAPILRVASLDTPVPFAKSLEAVFLANSRLAESLDKLLNY